jgi:hypothetical protein
MRQDRKFTPVVMMPKGSSVPYLVFAKGRARYHAVTADTMIRLVKLDTLRGLVEIRYKGKPYPPRRCASFWLNHGHRPITGRAKAVLRGLVARKKRQEEGL